VQAQKLVHHEVEGLDEAASLELLRCHHHFTKQRLQAWGLLEVEEQLRAACSGLPLALQVIGGELAVPSCLVEEVKRTWQVSSTQLAGLKPHGKQVNTCCGDQYAACMQQQRQYHQQQRQYHQHQHQHPIMP